MLPEDPGLIPFVRCPFTLARRTLFPQRPTSSASTLLNTSTVRCSYNPPVAIGTPPTPVSNSQKCGNPQTYKGLHEIPRAFFTRRNKGDSSCLASTCSRLPGGLPRTDPPPFTDPLYCFPYGFPVFLNFFFRSPRISYSYSVPLVSLRFPFFLFHFFLSPGISHSYSTPGAGSSPPVLSPFALFDSFTSLPSPIILSQSDGSFFSSPSSHRNVGRGSQAAS